jgi:glutamate dehydrogenase
MSSKSSFMVALEEAVQARLDAEEHELASNFASQFWARIPEDDLADRETADAAGITIAALRHFDRREADAVGIEVKNPEFERDGWSSRHTVVLIAHPDMSFITDSVLMQLSHNDLVTHQLHNVVFDVVRGPGGCLARLDPGTPGARQEVLIYAEIDRLEDDRLTELERRLAATLADVRAVVSDFALMKARLEGITAALSAAPPPLPRVEVDEGIAFLEWLPRANYTFLGYREFDFSDGRMRQVPGSALGVLRNRDLASERALADQSPETRAFVLEPRLLAFSKSGTRSQVHRPAYPDYVAVKRFDAAGHVIGEWGFLGMYTSPVYTERPESIPVLRHKVANVKVRAGFRPNGFDAKVLTQVLASYPRDELFQTDEDALLETALAITYIHERRRTRVFLRRDRYGLFYTCLVFLPRELFNTQLRIRIQRVLREALDAQDVPFDVHFSESILVRLHFTVRVPLGVVSKVDTRELERQIVQLTRDWAQDARRALVLEHGEVEGRRLAERYVEAFPGAYRERFVPRTAVADVAAMERLSAAAPLNMRLYRSPEEGARAVHLKAFHLGEPMMLSDVLPALENMGVRVVSEHPYEIDAAGRRVSIHDFELETRLPIDLVEVGDRFEDTLVEVWRGSADNDAFNRLVLSAGLRWREVTVLRAYAHYMKQIGFSFSRSFVADTLSAHPGIAARLVSYFTARFSPVAGDDAEAIKRDILVALDGVALLNEDRILRRFLELIDATLRTNHFQVDAQARPKRQLALKLAPAAVSNLPAPVPHFEIFVFSPRMEGVHLRGGAIARGGLRWSDRHEDYRTEVLGLVKAQIVKNAVIVPTGAKGGFVVRRPTVGHEVHGAAGLDCYREFIAGLLDVTDNVVGGVVVPPPAVRRYDGDDPYLVVAADKGTATFSDAANAVAHEYGFWLGDAFASGGSNGYDHKRMGITAKGAWICVERHFAERGIDVQSQPITVLGIGDMAGDVFGNGLLRSRAVQLVAAFNHQHVFLDPSPDPERSFAERTRLFALPQSTWADYDATLLSPGGGVFPRTQKSIRLSRQVRERLAIERERLSPDELIHELLKAPVDLIWNGGIGTYVKSSEESHTDVGDRANDAIRVDADALRAKVFGEGGNLGMTQRARIEFALRGGAVNTDFIDNAGGVDCSDHEVNLKILLDQVVADGDMTVKQRNELLASMTDAVAELVLTNSFRQAQTLALAEQQSRFRMSEYQRFIVRMEAEARLDRVLEGVPTDDAIGERAASGRALTRPELAILLCYAKIHLKQGFIERTVHRDPVVAEAAFEEFPAVIRERFADVARRHRLFAEIVATMVANDVVHHLGITSVAHLAEFVGGDVDEIARAYYAAAACFGVRERFRAIESLPGVDGATKVDMLLEQVQLARRATRWLLRHRRGRLDVAQITAYFKPRLEALLAQAAGLMGEAGRARRQGLLEARVAKGVPLETATIASNAAALAVTLPVIDAAETAQHAPAAVAGAFAVMNQALGFDWLAEQLMALPATSLWQAMERDALVDELVTQHAMLAAMSLDDTTEADSATVVANWSDRNSALLTSWRLALEGAQRAGSQDFALFSMTLRKLGDLTRNLKAAA